MLFHKICIVGAFGVGKTSLVRRYVSSIYDDRYLTTVGVRVDKKELLVGGRELTFVIWDIAGEDEITRLSMHHLRGMSGFFLVVDGCRADTLETAIRLRDEIDRNYPGVPFVLLMNKADLRSQWEVSMDRVNALGWEQLETSAKSGDGVEEAFARLASRLLT
jgi:hypothetical protein